MDTATCTCCAACGRALKFCHCAWLRSGLGGRQWSWPLWLPVQFLGIFPSSVLRDGDTTTPWAGEIEQKLFSSAVGAHHARRQSL